MINSLDRSKKNLFFFILTLFVVLIGLLQHEMWLDEVTAWLLVFESSTYKELLKRLIHESHPPLWHSLILVLNYFVNSPYVIQGVNFLISSLLFFLIYFKSPFSLLQKVLLSFNYYLLFEYSVISRNYLLGIVAFLYSVSFYSNRYKYPYRYFCAGLIMLGSHIFSMLMGFVLLFDFLLGSFLKKRNLKNILILEFFTYTLIGLFLYWYYLKGFNNFSFTLSFNRFKSVFGIINFALFPIPILKVSFWNTYLLKSFTNLNFIAAIISFSFMSIFLFKYSKRLLLIFITLITAILSLNYFGWYGFTRHHGIIFIIFLGMFWITKRSYQYTKKENLILTLLLFIQAGIGLFAYSVDFLHQFSTSQEVAKYIKMKKFDNYLILSDPEYSGVPISTYLRKNIFYPESNRFGMSLYYQNQVERTPGEYYFDKKRKIGLTTHLKNIKEFIFDYSSSTSILLITNYPLPKKFQETHSFTFEKSFENAIVQREEYWLYTLKRGIKVRNLTE